jgi:hypothetical protein
MISVEFHKCLFYCYKLQQDIIIITHGQPQNSIILQWHTHYQINVGDESRRHKKNAHGVEFTQRKKHQLYFSQGNVYETKLRRHIFNVTSCRKYVGTDQMTTL